MTLGISSEHAPLWPSRARLLHPELHYEQMPAGEGSQKL